MKVSDFIKLIKSVLEGNVLIVRSLLILGQTDDSCIVPSSCSGHKMVDVIIKFFENLVGLFIPNFKFIETAEHKVLLPKYFEELIGAIFANDLNELMDSLCVVVNVGNSSQILENCG